MFTPENSGVGPGGVAELMVDASGRVWAATLGGGLSVWDGAAWQAYRTSNSDIPLNEVRTLFEIEPGVIWVGLSHPTDFGGQVAAFDERTWQAFIPRNSGYSGSEPLVIAADASGRVWIGTRTRGADIYQVRR
jgi:ligand-binding sensor domain-containing protein